jgi:hypothetical protein
MADFEFSPVFTSSESEAKEKVQTFPVVKINVVYFYLKDC